MDFIFMSQNPEGDPGFSAEHNLRVMAETKRKNQEIRRKRIREHEENVRERASAAATFIKSVEKGGKTTNVQDYFGKKQLAYLRGEEILKELQQVRYARQGKIVTEGG